MKKSEMWSSEFILLVLIIFKAEASLPGDEAPQTILVNNMVVPAVRVDQADVDFTAEYHYVDGDIVNVACVNLLKEDRAPLTMEYEMAGTTSDKSVLKDISSSTMIGFIAKLHAGHNNSYMICTNTGPKDYTKVMIRFVMLTEPNIVGISINGMTLRPILNRAFNRNYSINYKSVSHQLMNVTCEVERTDVRLLVLDDDFDGAETTKTELTPMKKTEISFYLNLGDKRSLACAAEYVTGGSAELVNIMFTTADFPIDNHSSMHMELPPSGTVMELYSYEDYKLSVILYELKQNETLHLTCGPLTLPRGPAAPVIYLQLDNTEMCNTDGCKVSTTLQHVSREHVHPPIVCYLKEEHDPGLPSTTINPVYKEIRVILTTLTADIFTNNTATEPPSNY